MKPLFILTGMIASLFIGLYNFKKIPMETKNTIEEGITFFSGSLDDALKKSELEKKPIFLDVYASWCGPCIQLKKTTFKDKSVGDFFNSNFINVAIDGETSEGKNLILKYNIRSYPSLLILNSKAEVINRTVGFQMPEKLIDFGKKTLH